MDNWLKMYGEIFQTLEPKHLSFEFRLNISEGIILGLSAHFFLVSVIFLFRYYSKIFGFYFKTTFNENLLSIDFWSGLLFSLLD